MKLISVNYRDMYTILLFSKVLKDLFKFWNFIFRMCQKTETGFLENGVSAPLPFNGIYSHLPSKRAYPFIYFTKKFQPYPLNYISIWYVFFSIRFYPARLLDPAHFLGRWECSAWNGKKDYYLQFLGIKLFSQRKTFNWLPN